MVSGREFTSHPTELQLFTRHVDGHDYMYALSEMLDSAQEVIFILVRGFIFFGNILINVF